MASQVTSKPQSLRTGRAVCRIPAITLPGSDLTASTTKPARKPLSFAQSRRLLSHLCAKHAAVEVGTEPSQPASSSSEDCKPAEIVEAVVKDIDGDLVVLTLSDGTPGLLSREDITLRGQPNDLNALFAPGDTIVAFAVQRVAGTMQVSTEALETEPGSMLTNKEAVFDQARQWMSGSGVWQQDRRQKLINWLLHCHPLLQVPSLAIASADAAQLDEIAAEAERDVSSLPDTQQVLAEASGEESDGDEGNVDAAEASTSIHQSTSPRDTPAAEVPTDRPTEELAATVVESESSVDGPGTAVGAASASLSSDSEDPSQKDVIDEGEKDVIDEGEKDVIHGVDTDDTVADHNHEDDKSDGEEVQTPSRTVAGTVEAGSASIEESTESVNGTVEASTVAAETDSFDAPEAATSHATDTDANSRGETSGSPDDTVTASAFTSASNGQTPAAEEIHFSGNSQSISASLSVHDGQPAADEGNVLDSTETTSASSSIGDRDREADTAVEASSEQAVDVSSEQAVEVSSEQGVETGSEQAVEVSSEQDATPETRQLDQAGEAGPSSQEATQPKETVADVYRKLLASLRKNIDEVKPGTDGYDASYPAGTGTTTQASEVAHNLSSSSRTQHSAGNDDSAGERAEEGEEKLQSGSEEGGTEPSTAVQSVHVEGSEAAAGIEVGESTAAGTEVAAQELGAAVSSDAGTEGDKEHVEVQAISEGVDEGSVDSSVQQVVESLRDAAARVRQLQVSSRAGSQVPNPEQSSATSEEPHSKADGVLPDVPTDVPVVPDPAAETVGPDAANNDADVITLGDPAAPQDTSSSSAGTAAVQPSASSSEIGSSDADTAPDSTSDTISDIAFDMTTTSGTSRDTAIPGPSSPIEALRSPSTPRFTVPDDSQVEVPVLTSLQSRFPDIQMNTPHSNAAGNGTSRSGNAAGISNVGSNQEVVSGIKELYLELIEATAGLDSAAYQQAQEATSKWREARVMSQLSAVEVVMDARNTTAPTAVATSAPPGSSSSPPPPAPLLRVGDVATGEIIKIVPYGAFVQVAPGITALLHITQVSQQRVRQMSDVFSVGETVRALVFSTSMRQGIRRVLLSTKKLEQRPGDVLRDRAKVYREADKVALQFQKLWGVDQSGSTQHEPSANGAQNTASADRQAGDSPNESDSNKAEEEVGGGDGNEASGPGTAGSNGAGSMGQTGGVGVAVLREDLPLITSPDAGQAALAIMDALKHMVSINMEWVYQSPGAQEKFHQLIARLAVEVRLQLDARVLNTRKGMQSLLLCRFAGYHHFLVQLNHPDSDLIDQLELMVITGVLSAQPKVLHDLLWFLYKQPPPYADSVVEAVKERVLLWSGRRKPLPANCLLAGIRLLAKAGQHAWEASLDPLDACSLVAAEELVGACGCSADLIPLTTMVNSAEVRPSPKWVVTLMDQALGKYKDGLDNGVREGLKEQLSRMCQNMV